MGNECTNSCTQSEEEKSEIPTSREKKYAFKRMHKPKNEDEKLYYGLHTDFSDGIKRNIITTTTLTRRNDDFINGYYNGNIKIIIPTNPY